MKYGFTLNILDTPAALERVLRTIRHRGFTLTAMNLSTDRGILDANICVESELPAHLLQNQLAKLHDVMHIEAWEIDSYMAPTVKIQSTTRQ